ncbi:hypothetical protein ANN_11550 [Periplaneta americana]|uniref:Uncharacterized protein n=1 Tax=Periplaneta americana TaxID=6978 RepID=A0ABQ8T713_PERAM|nr:hypothetical protein ANN_11550 [Periplaneta americana]
MAGLFEGGNEPAGSLKAICKSRLSMHANEAATALFLPLSKATNKDDRPLRNAVGREICSPHPQFTCCSVAASGCTLAPSRASELARLGAADRLPPPGLAGLRRIPSSHPAVLSTRIRLSVRRTEAKRVDVLRLEDESPLLFSPHLTLETGWKK